MFEYRPTNKKCLEGKKVFEKFFDGEIIGYYYKVNKNKIKSIQRVLPKLGIAAYNKASLLNGWYLNEKQNNYVLFENGSKIKTTKILNEMPEGILH